MGEVDEDPPPWTSQMNTIDEDPPPWRSQRIAIAQKLESEAHCLARDMEHEDQEAANEDHKARDIEAADEDHKVHEAP